MRDWFILFRIYKRPFTSLLRCWVPVRAQLWQPCRLNKLMKCLVIQFRIHGALMWYKLGYSFVCGNPPENLVVYCVIQNVIEIPCSNTFAVESVKICPLMTFREGSFSLKTYCSLFCSLYTC